MEVSISIFLLRSFNYKGEMELGPTDLETVVSLQTKKKDIFYDCDLLTY